MLFGTGPRLKLISKENFNLYQGTLYMYEYEEVTEPREFHYDNRVSAYVSSSWHPSDNVGFSTTWYVQPHLLDFSDLRLSGQVKLDFSITEKLKFTTSFNYLLDTEPPVDVPKEVYALSNGLSYSF